MASDYSIKALRKEFKDKGVFYTPPELGECIKGIMGGHPAEVYDLTCGRGNLLSVFPDDVRKFGQEIDAEAVEDARAMLVNADIRQGDTIVEDKFPEKKFDYIIGNPPFSIRYTETEALRADDRFKDAPCLPPQSKADYLFILHSLAKLTESGSAYLLNAPGILYRGQREGKIRRWLIEKNYIDAVYMFPANQFTDTSISVCLLVLKKNRNGADSILFVDKEHELSRDVPLAEIAENDYTLSVQTYVEIPVEEKPYESPEVVNERVHQSNLRALDAMLKFEMFICDMEGWDFGKLLKDYQETINTYKGEITF